MAVGDIKSPEDIYGSRGYGITTTTAIQGKSADQMDMNDFFKLLTAQMTNQDMMDPQSNTEFIAQMAQFSSLQGMKTLQEYQLSSYAVSYIGKNVTIANVNEQTGELVRISGVVERVQFYDGQPHVIVKGKAYELHKIMEVYTDADTTDTEDPEEKLTLADARAMYVGKYVTFKYFDDDGEEVEVKGVVDRVIERDGELYAMVDGKEHPIDGIVYVEDKPPEPEEPEDLGELDID